MQDSLRIGTLVRGGEAVQVIPQIVEHGFESFQLNFWQTTGGIDLVEAWSGSGSWRRSITSSSLLSASTAIRWAAGRRLRQRPPWQAGSS